MIDIIRKKVAEAVLGKEHCSAFTKPLRIEFREEGDEFWTQEQIFAADDVNRAVRHLADFKRRFPKRNYRLIALAFEEL